jgi:hypothetical protein
MLLEELFQEGFSDLNLFKGDMADRKFKEPEPKREHPHSDDPERKTWYDAGGNPPGYGGTNRADNLAKSQVGIDKWNAMTAEEQTAAARAAAENANSSVDLPVKSAAERIADQTRRDKMTQAEIEADEKRKRAEHWAKLKKAREEEAAKIEAEKKKKAEAEKKKKAEADKNLAATHGN